MTTTTTNPYLRTKAMTASPTELRLMLLDGALKFAGLGEEALEKADYEATYTNISRCQAIIMELINALSPDPDPDLYKNLSGLYTFMYRRLMEAMREKNPAIVAEVRRLLEYERETWSMLIDKLIAENGAATMMNETPDAAPATWNSGGAADDLAVRVQA